MLDYLSVYLLRIVFNTFDVTFQEKRKKRIQNLVSYVRVLLKLPRDTAIVIVLSRRVGDKTSFSHFFGDMHVKLCEHGREKWALRERERYIRRKYVHTQKGGGGTGCTKP